MTETSKDKFKCFKCDVTYDLGKFKWLNRKWTEIHKRRKDYPIYLGNDNDDNNEESLPW